MREGMTNQKLAVQCGHWPLFRFHPQRAQEGKNPLQLDSKPPSIPLDKYAYTETRYKMLVKAMPDRARELMKRAQSDIRERWHLYEQLAELRTDGKPAETAGAAPPPPAAVAPAAPAAAAPARPAAPAQAEVKP